MIRLIVQAEPDYKRCERADTNHVDADFYSSEKKQKRQKRTHQSAKHKEE